MDILEHFGTWRNVITMPAGQELFHEGEPATVMYVLLDGSTNVIVGETIVEIAGPGALLGEMALVDEEPRSATVVSRMKSRLACVDRAYFDRLVREKPEFARHVMRVMADRLRSMNKAIRAAQGHNKIDAEQEAQPDKVNMNGTPSTDASTTAPN